MTTIALVSLVCRLALAGVLALSGTTKLADRSGARTALGAFGAPAWLVGPLAVVLPLFELAVAGLLLTGSTALAGSIGAAILLIVFTAAIARALAGGETPDCHCFGQLHSKPAGRMTLVRNGALMGIAAIAIVGSAVEPTPSAVAWIGDLDATQGALLAAAIALVATFSIGGAVVLSLMRSYGRVLVRLDRLEAALNEAGIDVGVDEEAPRLGLDPGTPAPWFLGTTPSGAGLSRDDLLAPGLPALLLFTSPHCAPCAALLPDAARWQRDHEDELTIAFASEGSTDAVGSEAAEFELERVLVDEHRAIAASFSANGTPSAVLIAADGTIASWLAFGRDDIEALVEDALLPAEGDGELPIGEHAPALELPSLTGEHISLAELRGRDTLLLFWNPGCGYCRAMHEDLLAWEQTANGVTPRLVIVSSGDPESMRAEGFRSLVLLDEDFAAGTAFGANGTPMAVLVDAAGRVGSPVAAGAESVLALANRHG